MGFGGGALIASPVSSELLGIYGDDGAGVASLFMTLGVVYLLVMLMGAALVRVPADDWQPEGFDPSKGESKSLVSTGHVSAKNSIKTPQFWLLWTILFCNVTAGIGILEQAAPMIRDFFREGSTSSVAAASAAGFVGVLSLANMVGRFVWSSTSDVIGRKPVYMMYLGVGIAAYVLLALFGSSSVIFFALLAALIISFYGGGFATVPAYLRDLFGTFQVGAIHGRLLTAWSAAGVAGPLIINGFLDAQGTPGELTSAAYRPALFTMVGLLAVGFVANLLVRPVDERWHEHSDTVERAKDTSNGRDRTGSAGSSVPSWLLPVAWAVVSVPLAYGVYKVLVTASNLFTGG
ncbi:hypothetical protein BH20ACT6_BH20ACT6_01720 [soil metagenome]